MIYVDILKTSLLDLEPSTPIARRGLYAQLIAGLKNSLETRKPPADRSELLVAVKLLRSTIQRFENDIRAGMDVTADEYVPEGLEEEQARLDAVLAIAQKRSAATNEGGHSAADTASLRLQMRDLSLAAKTEGFREFPLRPTTLGTVMSRFLADIAMARGYLGLIWILTEPCLLISTTVCGYLMLDESFIMSMDVIPFSIIGVVAWLMVRTTLIRVSMSPATGKDMLALPPIRILSLLFGQAVIQFFLYTISMVALLLFAAAFGHGEPPENIVLFLAYWILLWLIGIAAALIMAPFLAQWPHGARATTVGIRFLAWTSGIVYVSEQFPSELKYYLLLNPLCHGMQLMRSAYFSEYETQDASLFYLMSSLGVMLVIAAVGGRVLEPKVEPA